MLQEKVLAQLEKEGKSAKAAPKPKKAAGSKAAKGAEV